MSRSRRILLLIDVGAEANHKSSFSLVEQFSLVEIDVDALLINLVNKFHDTIKKLLYPSSPSKTTSFPNLS